MPIEVELTRPLVYFDLETTGTDTATDKIVQLSGTRFEVNKLGQKFNVYVNPERHIPQQATKIHRITDEMVANAAPFRELAKYVMGIFSGADWCGYNIRNFDVPLLLREFRECGYSFPELPRVVDAYCIFLRQQPHTLGGAVEYYLKCPAGSFGAHDARNDVEATIRVLDEQIRRGAPANIAELNEYCNRDGQLDLAGKLRMDQQLGPVLTFGKYKDTPLRQIPEPYFSWCWSENVLGPDAWKVVRDTLRGVQ